MSIFLDTTVGSNTNPENLPIVRTGRDMETINQAVRDGFIAVFRKVEPDRKLRAKYAVVQNMRTGEFMVLRDFRSPLRMGGDVLRKVIDWSNYYPYNFASPYAAYLVPSDLPANTRVLLEDVIEDLVGLAWNQGDTFRVDSSPALWTGDDIVIEYDAGRNVRMMIG